MSWAILGESQKRPQAILWAILGGSQKRPQAILSGSQQVTAVRSKDLPSLDVHRSSRTHVVCCACEKSVGPPAVPHGFRDSFGGRSTRLKLFFEGGGSSLWRPRRKSMSLTLFR